MSYILDALRRAEADRTRERGAVPGLHDHVPLMTDAVGADLSNLPRTSRRPLWLALGVALAFGLGAAVWLRGPEPQRSAAADPVATPDSVPLAPLPTLLTQPAPPPNLRADSQAVPLQPQLPGTVPRQTPLPARSPNPTPAPAPALSPAPTAAPATARSALQTLRELNPQLRRELPALAVSGAMYSPQANSRMLVLDGQVLREGQAVSGINGTTAGPLLVEQIGTKSAVLSYKGQRFELPY